MRVAVRDARQVRGADTVFTGSLTATTDWSRAVAGIDAVYHLAGHAHASDHTSAAAAATYRDVNVHGTTALARAAAAAGVRHFVYVSSVKAAAESAITPLRESDSPSPEDEYGRSKLAAEEALAIVRQETGMYVSIIRPPLVYGPGVKANFLRLIRAVDRGLPLPLGSLKNRRSLVYVGNLVDALITCVRHGERASATFFVSDGEDVSTPELVRMIGRALGRKPHLLGVPPKLLALAGTAVGRAAAVNRLAGSLVVDIAAIREALQWQPVFTLAEGLDLTAQWYKAERRRALV